MRRRLRDGTPPPISDASEIAGQTGWLDTGVHHAIAEVTRVF
ncbi:MAG TPA: hypothetical protein VGC00_03030 [Thermoanaerobaculia bacterium]